MRLCIVTDTEDIWGEVTGGKEAQKASRKIRSGRRQKVFFYDIFAETANVFCAENKKAGSFMNMHGRESPLEIQLRPVRIEKLDIGNQSDAKGSHIRSDLL